jgi:CRISPR-associated endonuclease Csy4
MNAITTPVIASHYREFTCLSDAEISTGFLMGRLMHALHLTMVNATAASGACPFGVSFPDYRTVASDRGQSRRSGSAVDDRDGGLPVGPPIGGRVRLFARSEAELDSIEWSRSLIGLDDYVHRTGTRKVSPSVELHATFARRQPSASPDRLIRRAMKRKGIDEVEARRRYANHQMDRCELPYLDMHSDSTGNRFRLFIERSPSPASDAWGFSTYGLSRTVPVPNF